MSSAQNDGILGASATEETSKNPKPESSIAPDAPPDKAFSRIAASELGKLEIFLPHTDGEPTEPVLFALDLAQARRRWPDQQIGATDEALTDDDRAALADAGIVILPPLPQVDHHGGEQDAGGFDDDSPAGGDELPTVVVNRQPSAVRRDAWKALRLTNDPPTLFERGSVVTQIVKGGARVVTPDVLRGPLEDGAQWVNAKQTKEGTKYTPATVPGKLPPTMLAEARHPLPELLAIATTPCVGPDGGLITQPGYHAVARIYLDTMDMRMEVPEKPTAAHVDAARTLIIDDLLGDFPFVSESDRAHAVAALLHQVVRAMVSGPTPLHVFEATTQGTGKGLLATVIAIIVTGADAAPTKFPSGEEERRKKITALLSSGTSMIMLDNETGVLRSATLDAALTAAVWSDRILGVTAMAHCPNLPLWILTSNNAQLGGDLPRRTIRCRMDAEMEQPWLRDKFRHEDLVQWTRDHRPELCGALLTMVMHWIAIGRPEYTARTLGSFGPWARTIGGILDAAGVPGFLKNLDEWYEVADSDAAEWRVLVTAWAESYGSGFRTTTQIVNLANQLELFSSLLGGRVDGRPNRSAVTRMGEKLSGSHNAIVAGHRIVKTHGRKGAVYQVVEVSNNHNSVSNNHNSVPNLGSAPGDEVRHTIVISEQKAPNLPNLCRTSDPAGSADVSTIETGDCAEVPNLPNLKPSCSPREIIPPPSNSAVNSAPRDIKGLRDTEDTDPRIDAGDGSQVRQVRHTIVISEQKAPSHDDEEILS